jgi:hypothetical protein
VWPFLLGVYEWDATTEERDKLWEEKRCIPVISPVYGSCLTSVDCTQEAILRTQR